VHLRFVYPMRQMTAICVSVLAGALLATCAGRHTLSQAWSVTTGVVASISLIGLVLHWSSLEADSSALFRLFSHISTALPIGVSFLIGGAAVWAVAADQPSPHRLVFAAIAGVIASTLGFAGLLNGLFGIIPANEAFEGELAVDATFSVALIGIAILSVSFMRARQLPDRIYFVAPLVVAIIGTIGSFLMWRFLLEERTKATAFQTSNAATMVQGALTSEFRHLVRQLRYSANDRSPAMFQQTEVPPESHVIWADSRTLAPEERYLEEALHGGQYGLALAPGGTPELVITAPKRDGSLRIAAFPAHGFLDPILSGVLGSNFNMSLLRGGKSIYSYPPSPGSTGHPAAGILTRLPEMNITLHMEPRSDFVRRGGTTSLHLALIMGLVASFLLAFSVYLLHASRTTLAEVQEARAGLELEVEQRRHAEEELDQKARQLQASNTELQEFAHVVSHDLQEPLRSIRGFAQLIARRYNGQLDEDGHEFLQYITDSSTRMNSMIQGLLAYSRLGHADQHAEVFSLSEAVEWAQSNLTMAIEECEATIEVGELPKVKGNRLQFCQLMQNLLGNALKYKGQEKPIIRITSRKQGSEHIITVADNGVGIGPEFQHRIFGLFKRAHGNDYPGAGVGLALCKKIVERHGGQIWVESSLGKGSQFHIRIPEIKSDSRTTSTRDLRRTDSNPGMTKVM
jgi:signal transduction histidine kinase